MFHSQFALIARFTLIAATGALIAGCATSPGDDLAPYGASVRHAMESQTYRQGDSAPPLKGDQAVKAMEAYRGPVAAQPILDAALMGME